MEQDKLHCTLNLFERGLRMSFRDLVNPNSSLGPTTGYSAGKVNIAGMGSYSGEYIQTVAK